MTKLHMLVVLLGAIALIPVILALQLIAPGDVIQQSGADNAKIIFSADHGMLLAPGACVTVRWHVEGIQGVYIDGERTVGDFSRRMCVDDATMPVLTVQFKDNTSSDYHLNIEFLVEQPSTWLLASAGALLALISLGVVLSRPLQPVAQTRGRRTPRLFFVFAGIGMVVSGIAVFALILEVCLRLYFGQFGSRQEQEAYLDTRAQIEARESPILSLPYIEYGLSPDYPGQNQLGYRGDEVQVPKPNGTYRIVALGDSSTYGSLVPYDETYSYDLQQILRQAYAGRNIEVVNGGVTNYNSWNILIDLAFRVAVLQPDLVIIYDGWNDLDAREQSPDCYRSATPYLGLGSPYTLRSEPAPLSASALYRFAGIHLGWMTNPALEYDSSASTGIACSPQTTTEFAQNLAANPPIYFERNQRDLIALAKANSYQIMFMTWAYDKTSPQLPEYRPAGLVQDNAVTKQVAQENNVPLFDYAASAQSGPDFWSDVAHHNAQGNLVQAQAIAQFLIDHDIIPASAAATT